MRSLIDPAPQYSITICHSGRLKHSYPEIVIFVVAAIVSHDELGFAGLEDRYLLHQLIQVRLHWNNLDRNDSARLLVTRLLNGPIGTTRSHPHRLPYPSPIFSMISKICSGSVGALAAIDSANV